jgi:hypothetical protein
MPYTELIIAAGSEWETLVLDARGHAPWSQAFGRRLNGHPERIYWHHSVYPVAPLEPDEQLAWLVRTIPAGTYGWPYNFLAWPSESFTTLWYLNDVDEYHAHTYSHNDQIAICGHGNYEANEPPSHLVAAMWHLSGALQNMWGARLEVLPHRAVYATACPGVHLTAELEALTG